MRYHLLTLCALSSTYFAVPTRAEEEKKDPPREETKTEKPGQRAVGKTDDSPRPAPVPKREANSPKPEKRTWVGVATTGIDDVLREHLELPEGFGIQIVEVIPESPASLAGLRNNDIVTSFEDQHLISPEHLSLLVNAGKSGDKVPITIIRKGKEEVIEVTLGETAEDRFNRPPSPRSLLPEPHFPPFHHRNDPNWEESINRQHKYWEDWMNRNRPEWRGNPSRRDVPQREDGDEPSQARGPGEGRPPAISVNPGFPLRVFGSEGVLKIDNEQGELTLTRKDKDHTLELKNVDGEVVYSGPFDPEAGVEGLPQEARDQLKTMKLDNFEIRLPDAPMKDPEKTATPPVEKPASAPERRIL